MTLVAQLAQQTGRQVIKPGFERFPFGKGFCLHMRTMNAAEFKDASASPEQAAVVVNRGVEDMVRHAPGQYLWAYDRDKQPRSESQT